MNRQTDKIETICAVVVTYNRKLLLLECLESLIKQTHPIDALYIIDNASTDGTPVVLKEKGYIKEILSVQKEPIEVEYTLDVLSNGSKYRQVKVHYLRLNENTGGAGGFFEGVKRGYEKGYDWLWLMDDDAEPSSDCLAELYTSIRNLPENVILVSPLKFDRDGEIQQHHCGFIKKDKFQMISLTAAQYSSMDHYTEIDYSSFVGPMISSRVILKAGFPDKDFFIWHDDIEYCCRLREYGEIYLVKKAKITHKDRPQKTYENSCKEKKSDLWKIYFGKRNSIFLYKRYRSNRLKVWSELLYFFLRDFKDIIFHYDYKIERLFLLTISYWHGILGVKGMKINPRIWYEKYNNQSK